MESFAGIMDSIAKREYGSSVGVRAYSVGAIIIEHTVSEGEPDGECGMAISLVSELTGFSEDRVRELSKRKV